MKLLDIMTGSWMIAPAKLTEIKKIYDAHIKSGKIDIKELEEKVTASLNRKTGKEPYDILDGAAIIPVKGVLAKETDFFSFFFGGASTRDISALIAEALTDSAVESIVLDIDSPGGTVDGTQELAESVFAGRGQKPILAYTDGMMASAAYYIAAAADKIFISGDMPEVGSIGVVMSHIDFSKMDERIGIKETEIYAGKYKRIASYTKPLSKEGKEYLQDQVDYMYSIFVTDVARYRGTTVDDVLKNMADGKLFIGRQALDAGLVDGVSTFDQVISTELPQMQSKLSARLWLANLNKELKA